MIHATVRASWLVGPYGLRYYVADFTPLMLVTAAMGIAYLLSRVSVPVLRSTLCLVLAAACLVPSITPLRWLRHYQGMRWTSEDLQQFAAQFPPDAVVLFDNQSNVKAFQSAVLCLFGLEAYQVAVSDLSALATGMRATGRPVFYVTDQEDLPPVEIPLEGHSLLEIRVNEIEQRGVYAKLRWTEAFARVPAKIYCLGQEGSVVP